MSIITFIGAGQMASALTFPAFENGHEVRLVGTPLDRDIISELKKTNYHKNLKRTLHSGIKYYQVEKMEEAVKGASVILGGVSSFGVDWFAQNVLPITPSDVPILSVTKGMLDQKDGSMMTYPEYWESTKAGSNLSINAIGGPCTSYELADKDHSSVAFCGKNINTLRELKALFSTDYYHISLSTDVIGVECAVALKNAYALGVSLAVGLTEKKEGIGSVHYNSQAALFEQSIREMRKLLKIVGGKDDNIVYGAGDLYVTIFGGRTRKIGTLLGRGLSFKEAINELKGVTLESIIIATRTARSVKTLVNNGTVLEKEFPLLMHVDAIINDNQSVNIPWQSFEIEYTGN